MTFHNKEGDEVIYFSTEGPKEQVHDVGPSGGLPLLSVRVRSSSRETIPRM